MDAPIASLRGQLLVAAPTLVDPNFEQTVVLLLEHADEGALGVVLNRPSPVPVEGALPSWEPLVARPSVVFIGGPVAPDAVIGLAASTDAPPPLHLDGDDPDDDGGWQPIIDGLGVLDLSREPDEVAVAVRELRLFAGYAGWGAGQLESEIEEGAWFVVDAHTDDGLSDDPDGMWREVLRRQGGVFTTVSPDPSLN